MAQAYTSFRDIIYDIWGPPHVMAPEVGASVVQARKWATRDMIPSEYWVPTVYAAQKRGKKLTFENLAQIEYDKL